MFLFKKNNSLLEEVEETFEWVLASTASSWCLALPGTDEGFGADLGG